MGFYLSSFLHIFQRFSLHCISSIGSGVPEVDEFPIYPCSSNTEHRAWHGKDFHVVGSVSEQVDGWVDGWMDEDMDGWMDGGMDGWMDGWMGGWMDW